MDKDLKLLVVDDDPDIRFATVRVLRTAGYEVEEAETGEQCLDIVRNKMPDLVLLDVILPDLDGYTLCRYIKEDKTVNTYVLLISGKKTTAEDHSLGLEIGADGYLKRPISNRELLAWVQALVRIIVAEKKLQTSEETYRNLFQNAQVGLFRSRIEDGTILESNEQLAKMFGYENKQDILSDNFFSKHYVDPDTRKRMLKAIKENGEIENFEAKFYRKDGNIFWALFSAQFYPEQGWIEGVAEDITHLKQTQEKLFQAKEDAKAANKSKSEFLANMSHEIRTPINGIMGMLQLLQTSNLNHEEEKYVKTGLESTRRLNRLLTDILDLSKIEANKLVIKEEEFVFADAIKTIEDIFNQLTKESQNDLSISLDENLPEKLVSDSTRLNQILFNLVAMQINTLKMARLNWKFPFCPDYKPITAGYCL